MKNKSEFGIIAIGIGIVLAITYLTKKGVEMIISVTDENRLQFLKDMKVCWEQVYRKYGIKSNILLTQAVHESNWGQSGLSKEAFNLFGMKATDSWIKAGKPVWTGQTTEYFNPATPSQVVAGFKKYGSYMESCLDWATLISQNSRYANAYAFAKAGDIINFAKAIYEGGYATDPKYADKLVSVEYAVNKKLTEWQSVLSDYAKTYEETEKSFRENKA